MNLIIERNTERQNRLQHSSPEKIHLPVDLNSFRTSSTLVAFGAILAIWLDKSRSNNLLPVVFVIWSSRIFLFGLVFKIVCTSAASLGSRRLFFGK